MYGQHSSREIFSFLWKPLKMRSSISFSLDLDLILKASKLLVNHGRCLPYALELYILLHSSSVK